LGDGVLPYPIKSQPNQKSDRQTEKEGAGDQPMRKFPHSLGAKRVAQVGHHAANHQSRKIQPLRTKSPQGKDRRRVSQWKSHDH
jgi:hypothetical protein